MDKIITPDGVPDEVCPFLTAPITIRENPVMVFTPCLKEKCLFYDTGCIIKKAIIPDLKPE